MKNFIDTMKHLTGDVLCVGVSQNSILDALMKNNQVSVYSLNRAPGRQIFSRRKKRAKLKSKNKEKKVNIKKLSKAFPKKSVDYIVCDWNEVYDCFKYFLYQSVRINKKKTYLYGTSKYIDPYVVAKRFERYHATTTVTVEEDKFWIVIDNENSKVGFWKAKFFVIVDTFHNLGDMISTALIS